MKSVGATLSRRFSADRRYRQRDLDQMYSLAELVIRTVTPFERLRRLTATETALLNAAHIISCSVRRDAAGEFHLRNTPQLTLEEAAANGHH